MRKGRHVERGYGRALVFVCVVNGNGGGMQEDGEWSLANSIDLEQLDLEPQCRVWRDGLPKAAVSIRLETHRRSKAA